MNPDSEHRSEPWLQRMEEIYEDYSAEAWEYERRRKPTDGLLGMKGGPADDPSHDRFAKALGDCLAEFAAAAPDSASVRAVLERLYAPPDKGAVTQSAYWMLIAVQGLQTGLIDSLAGEDARALCERYAGDYPRWQRLPVQKKIFAALKAKAK